MIITEHNRPSFVLLRYDEFERLQGVPGDMAAWLQMAEDVEFDIEPLGLNIRAADLDPR